MTTLSLLLGFVACFYVSNGALSDAQKSDLLSWHNEYRSTSAQGQQTCASDFGSSHDTTCPAGTIQKLKWDAGLANVAQDYADALVSRYTNCGLAHSNRDDRKDAVAAETTTFSYDGTSGIGENLAVAGGGRTPRQTVDGWVTGEAEYFIYGESDPSVETYTDSSNRVRQTQIGHHTQVVSHYSEYVGCGCSTGDDDECGPSTLFCVCNYYPAGNTNIWGGVNYQTHPYANDGACGSCDSGDTCSASTDYLCDDGADDGLSGSGSSPSGNTNTTPEPTPSPVDVIDDSTDDTSTSTAGVVLTSTTHSGFNGLAFPAITNAYTSLSKTVYGPATAYGYTTALLYSESNSKWYLLLKDFYDDYNGYIYSFCECECTDCEVYDCPSWNQYITSVQTTTAAYSVTNSSDKDDNQLIEGLMIGLGIAIGVFIIGLIIYCLVKRRNSKQSRYNVVEMNNEISDHDYVNMGN